MDAERIGALARSFADTIGARAFEQRGGGFDYSIAATEIRRLIAMVIDEVKRDDEATSGGATVRP